MTRQSQVLPNIVLLINSIQVNLHTMVHSEDAPRESQRQIGRLLHEIRGSLRQSFERLAPTRRVEIMLILLPKRQ